MIRRIHDINLSGWWCIAFILLSVIPIVGMLSTLFLYFKPGDTGSNRFGPPGPPNSQALKIGTWICGILFALLSIGNIIMMFTSLAA